MKVMFSNVSGGLVFAGKLYGEMLFSKVSVESYIEFFQTKQPDILCLSEAHLENKHESAMVAHIADSLDLPHYACLALSGSHLDTSKQQGAAILSRYPIVSREEFTIPSPGLEVNRPNGDHWKMFDKGALRAQLNVDGKTITIVCFSYFPFHHFNRSVTEPEFRDLRRQLLEILLGGNNSPTIITGDFNSKGHTISEAFPELFENNALKQAVDVETTVIGANDQLDHILYQPQFFKASDGIAEYNDSDHLAISARIELV